MEREVVYLTHLGSIVLSACSTLRYTYFFRACQDTSMPDSQALKTEEDWLSLGGLNAFPGMSRSESDLFEIS